jgi:hypothetical protein
MDGGVDSTIATSAPLFVSKVMDSWGMSFSIGCSPPPGVCFNKIQNFDQFSRPEPLFFFKVALNCNHEAEWTLFQTHCFSEKSGSARNRTQDLWVCSQELWPLDHRYMQEWN